MALWFGISYVELDTGETIGQQIHGPYEDPESLNAAMEEKVEDASSYGQGETILAIPISFELCTDDVPELMTLDDIWKAM